MSRAYPATNLQTEKAPYRRGAFSYPQVLLDGYMNTCIIHVLAVTKFILATAKDRRVAQLWASGAINGSEAAKKLKVAHQNVGWKIARALKQIHYEED